MLRHAASGVGGDVGRVSQWTWRWLARVVAGMALVAGMTAPGLDAPAGDWGPGMAGAAYRLVPSGTWHARRMGSGAGYGGHGTPVLQGSYTAVYVADVEPGQIYDLGLRLQAELNTRVRVAIFDRPPWAAGARRFDLPMGPVVRTVSPEVEYRWHVGISPRSEGRAMFITIEAVPGTPADWHRLWYAIYLARAPRRPMDSFGRGVTYLAGPSDLVLARGEERPLMVVVAPDPAASGRAPAGSGWVPNLIPNGDFGRGLEGWALLPGNDDAAAGRVAVDDDGLIVRGGGAARAGVRQVLQRRVASGRPLLLGTVVRLEQGEAAGDAGAAAVLEVSVCYLDERDEEHCGARAWRRRFVTQVAGGSGTETVRVPPGVWYESEDDLGRLTPAPAVITSVGITGGAAVGGMARVRAIWLRQP